MRDVPEGVEIKNVIALSGLGIALNWPNLACRLSTTGDEDGCSNSEHGDCGTQSVDDQEYFKLHPQFQPMEML